MAPSSPLSSNDKIESAIDFNLIDCIMFSQRLVTNSKEKLGDYKH